MTLMEQGLKNRDNKDLASDAGMDRWYLPLVLQQSLEFRRKSLHKGEKVKDPNRSPYLAEWNLLIEIKVPRTVELLGQYLYLLAIVFS